jgi:hypothetical protein
MMHDLEEIITVEHFMTRRKNEVIARFPARIRPLVERNLSMKTAQFAVAVAWLFLIISVITVFTVHSLEGGGNFLLFLALLNVFFLHVFTHVGQSIVFRGYTPGVVTAILVVFPYSLYTYYRLLESGFIDWHLIFVSAPISILALPAIFIGHILGRRSVR